MTNKGIRIMQYCIIMFVVVLLIDGTSEIINKSKLYSLKAHDVISQKDSKYFLYSSSKKEESECEILYLGFGGIDTITEMTVSRDLELIIGKKEYLGNVKIIILDKNNNKIMLELNDEPEIKTVLSGGIYKVLAVGNVFCGSIYYSFLNL